MGAELLSFVERLSLFEGCLASYNIHWLLTNNQHTCSDGNDHTVSTVSVHWISSAFTIIMHFQPCEMMENFIFLLAVAIDGLIVSCLIYWSRSYHRVPLENQVHLRLFSVCVIGIIHSLEQAIIALCYDVSCSQSWMTLHVASSSIWSWNQGDLVVFFIDRGHFTATW